MSLASLGPIDEKWSLNAFDNAEDSDIEIPGCTRPRLMSVRQLVDSASSRRISVLYLLSKGSLPEDIIVQ